MKNALNVFHALINQGAISDGLYQYLDSQKIPLDFSDLLRWQWTLSVSALDRYIHDIVRIGMVQIFEGKRSQTPKYQAFHIGMNEFINITTAPVSAIEFEKAVARQHSFLAFQLPDKIADALAYIWDEKGKWDTISSHMKTAISSHDLRVKLTNIVTRRNQIVHEGDCFSTALPLQQQPISLENIKDVINFITELAEAISISIA